jgi:hypothetical protein
MLRRVISWPLLEDSDAPGEAHMVIFHLFHEFSTLLPGVLSNVLGYGEPSNAMTSIQEFLPKLYFTGPLHKPMHHT